jgi:hypothetical protein
MPEPQSVARPRVAVVFMILIASWLAPKDLRYQTFRSICKGCEIMELSRMGG